MNLAIRMPNGEEIAAPTEEWLAAILSEMSPEVRVRVLERIRKKTVFYATPGSHVLRAEGGIISSLRGKG